MVEHVTCHCFAPVLEISVLWAKAVRVWNYLLAPIRLC